MDVEKRKLHFLRVSYNKEMEKSKKLEEQMVQLENEKLELNLKIYQLEQSTGKK
jgi:hypothetical protein